MISLIIPPKDQISRVAKMLADEFGTASNIKSRVNRLSVLGAITSVQQRLKLYNKGNFQHLWLLANFPHLEAVLSFCIHKQNSAIRSVSPCCCLALVFQICWMTAVGVALGNE